MLLTNRQQITATENITSFAKETNNSLRSTVQQCYKFNIFKIKKIHILAIWKVYLEVVVESELQEPSLDMFLAIVPFVVDYHQRNHYTHV